jgi:hypothetical protein
VAASAVSVAGASAAARRNPFQLWPPSGGGVTSDYLTPTRLRKSELLPIGYTAYGAAEKAGSLTIRNGSSSSLRLSFCGC